MATDPDPDVGSGDEVVVSKGDVTVSKAFSPDGFPVPVIRFDIRSEADSPVELLWTVLGRIEGRLSDGDD